MEPQDTSRSILQRLKQPFKTRSQPHNPSHEQRGADSSASTNPQSEPNVTITEPFPVGVQDWVKCDGADVDICFIHGLTGNRDSTWTAKGQKDPWPKTLLSTGLQPLKARIFTYGYDAYIVRLGQASMQRMTDHAIDFLHKVTADRLRNEALDRPLIIIAHSVGGLVAKQAILKSRGSADAHLRNLYDMIDGIIFLGTPHTGSWIAKWAKISAGIFEIMKSTNKKLLEVLQTSNELLESLNQDFAAMLRTIRENPKDDKNINVKCFYEVLGYPLVGLIVSKESATFVSDYAIGIHGNHGDIVKFATPSDDGFKNIVDQLKLWTMNLREGTTNQLQQQQDLTEIALEILEVSRTESAREAMASCLKLLHLEDDVSLIRKSRAKGDKRAMKEQESIVTHVKDAYRDAAKRCRLSLTFDDMMIREESIQRPEDKTCQWIYQTKQYKEWITNEKSLLWIKGNPGSGKSILMKSLYLRRQQDLRGSKTILLRHFFNARGSDMERSQEGLYRTLLYSLALKVPTIPCEVLARHLEKEIRGHTVRWQTTELVEIFHDWIMHLQTHNIEILIDALDECSDNDVLDVVRRFERSIQAPQNHTSLRVCWSSRFYRRISLTTLRGFELVVNNHNEEDIRKYVENIFGPNLERKLEPIRETIISRARGIFLWVSLVAKKLIKAFDAGRDEDQLWNMLRNIPNDLDALFSSIFEEPGFTTEQSDDLRRILYFVLGAIRSMSIRELYTAFLWEEDNVSLPLNFVDHESDDLERFQKRVTYASGGLIEIIDTAEGEVPGTGSTYLSTQSGLLLETNSFDDKIVQVIHESVREYFLGRGRHIIQISSSKDFITTCHSRIIRAGFNILTKIATELDTTKRHQSENHLSPIDTLLNSIIPTDLWFTPRLSFLNCYVLHNIFTHFDYVRVRTSDESMNSLLQSLTIRQNALYAYMRICCFEFHHGNGLSRYIEKQLKIILKHSDAFKLDDRVLFDILDLPVRLQVGLDFLLFSEIPIFRVHPTLFQVDPNLNHHPEDRSRFVAIFSAGNDQQRPKMPQFEHSTRGSTKDRTDTDAKLMKSRDGGWSDGFPRQEISSDDPVPLFGISFFMPVASGPPQLKPTASFFGAANAKRAISTDEIITDWRIVSITDLESYSPRLSECSQSQAVTNLTLSKPPFLACQLFHWPRAEDGSSGRHQLDFMQAGTRRVLWLQPGYFDQPYVIRTSNLDL
ncbi:hypothetical protein F4777DRAFT_537725 [Nemania sp. FL0916]|nr:hypothetical protein F4777DRAFT_537725 [Nemania sp. FL0916]